MPTLIADTGSWWRKHPAYSSLQKLRRTFSVLPAFTHSWHHVTWLLLSFWASSKEALFYWVIQYLWLEPVLQTAVHISKQQANQGIHPQHTHHTHTHTHARTYTHTYTEVTHTHIQTHIHTHTLSLSLTHTQTFLEATQTHAHAHLHTHKRTHTRQAIDYPPNI